MTEHNIIAVLYPAAGKVDQMRKALRTMVEAVHAKEDYTLRYLVSEEIENETPAIAIVETYKSKEAMAQHNEESHFKAFFKEMTDNNLMAKEPLILRTTDQGGFDKDRKLVGSSS